MGNPALDVRTAPDGSVIIRAQGVGVIGPDEAVELRHVLVRTIRQLRPRRLVLDLTDVSGRDLISVGTLVAVCGIGDDHRVVVFLDNCPVGIAEQLTAADVPAQRLRRVGGRGIDQPPS